MSHSNTHVKRIALYLFLHQTVTFVLLGLYYKTETSLCAKIFNIIVCFGCAVGLKICVDVLENNTSLWKINTQSGVFAFLTFSCFILGNIECLQKISESQFTPLHINTIIITTMLYGVLLYDIKNIYGHNSSLRTGDVFIQKAVVYYIFNIIYGCIYACTYARYIKDVAPYHTQLFKIHFIISEICAATLLIMLRHIISYKNRMVNDISILFAIIQAVVIPVYSVYIHIASCLSYDCGNYMNILYVIVIANALFCYLGCSMIPVIILVIYKCSCHAHRMPETRLTDTNSNNEHEMTVISEKKENYMSSDSNITV